MYGIILFVLSYVTTASGGAASPGLGGQRTPRGKGKGKDMGITTYGGGAGEFLKQKVSRRRFFPQKTHLLFRPRDPSKKMWQVLGIKLLQFLAQESFSKGELWSFEVGHMTLSNFEMLAHISKNTVSFQALGPI